MIAGGVGGANTGTGLAFERDVDLKRLLESVPGYRVVATTNDSGHKIYFNEKLVARCFQKHKFYNFLQEKNVNWENIVSKKLLPDDALIVIVQNKLFIIEVKYQQGAGSVDEKLQTCDFKRKQFQKLVKQLGLFVEYVYVLNEWFEERKDKEYKDVLDYITSMGCHYYFHRIPLSWFGLPDPNGSLIS